MGGDTHRDSADTSSAVRGPAACSWSALDSRKAAISVMSVPTAEADGHASLAVGVDDEEGEDEWTGGASTIRRKCSTGAYRPSPCGVTSASEGGVAGRPPAGR